MGRDLQKTKSGTELWLQVREGKKSNFKRVLSKGAQSDFLGQASAR